MDAASLFADKRQFGRRDTSIRGAAILPRQSSQPFTIRNISDGGALLAFDDAFELPPSFRIEIDDTQFMLWCEVCHISSNGVGVRFMRQAEGAALNRYFQLRPVQGLTALSPPPPAAPAPARPTISNLDLRTEYLLALARRARAGQVGVA